MNTDKLSIENEAPILRIGAVMPRFSSVLSLFDGISCGMIALERAGIKIDDYYSSEIDKNAISISKKNYPNIKQLGDVRKLTYEQLPKIDLLIGGSPCQSFSSVGNGSGFDGKSGLFWEYVRILKEVKPTYFLLENVVMKKEWEDIITDTLCVKPIKINSRLFSAQNRPRLYWTNIPNVVEPNKIDIKLKDILEKEVAERYNIKNERVGTLMKFLSNNYKVNGKVPTLTTELAHSTGKNFYPKALAEIYDVLGYYRRLTPIEVERLQTVPDNYTSAVIDTERYRMLGNGWTVDVIAHIFSFLKGGEIFNNFSNENV